MAVSAREILLIFRGQNMMGSAVRGAAADVKSLDAAVAARNKTQSLAATRTQQAARAQRQYQDAYKQYYDIRKKYADRDQKLNETRLNALAREKTLLDQMASLERRKVDPNSNRYIAVADRLESIQSRIERLTREQTQLPALEDAALSAQAAKVTILKNRWDELAAEASRYNDEITESNVKIALMNQQLKEQDSVGLMGALGLMGAHRRAGSGFGLGGLLLGGLFLGGFPHFAFGSVGQLMGGGAERVAGTALGLLGSIGGGLLGGGLLAGGALGVTAVGMGTNLAGLGQAAGDIKNVTQGLNNLDQMVKTYGPDSRQAIQAQQQLNTTLSDFNPIARQAVLSAAKTSIGFRNMFDMVSGLAEKTGAQIINQAQKVGEKFLPTVGRFATKNMSIIQQNLQPLFAWVQNPSFSKPGFGGGLGIFTNLEQLFQKRLPSAVQAGSQAFEFFLRTVDVAAQRSGGFMQAIDNFFTKENKPKAFTTWASDVNKLIDYFMNLVHLVQSFGRIIFTIVPAVAGVGSAIIKGLTSGFNAINSWLSQSGTQNILKNLFSVHLKQITQGFFAILKAGLPVVEKFVSAFMQIEAALAPFLTWVLKTVASIISGISNSPFISKMLAWAAAAGVAAFAFGKLAIALKLATSWQTIMAGVFGTETKVIAAEATAVTGLTAGLLKMALFVGAGIYGRQLTRRYIHGTAGGILGDAVLGAGLGAAAGMFVGMPLLGAGIGAGIGALVGGIAALTRSAPSAVQQLKLLGYQFSQLQQSAAGAAGHLKQMTLIRMGAQFFTTLKNSGVLTPGGEVSMWGASAAGIASFTSKFQDMASTLRQQGEPRLAQVADLLVMIANETHKIPSKKDIRILLNAEMSGKTKEVLAKVFGMNMGGGPVGPQGPIRFPTGPDPKYVKMLQAATDAGVVATKQYTKLYNAAVKAQNAFNANPNPQTQAALVAANKALNDYQNNVTQVNQKIAQNTQLTFQNVLNSVQGMYDTLLQNEQNTFGTLFSGPFMNSPIMQNYTAWGGKATGKQLTRDLGSQIWQFRAFHKALNELTARGAPFQLIQQLMNLGPSSLPQIRALLAMSTQGLTHYFDMFRQAQNMIQRQTLIDLNKQLAEYRKFGRNIALAIVAGLQDQNAAVVGALKKMIRQAFPGLKGSGQYAAPKNQATVHLGHTPAGGSHGTTHGPTHRGRVRRHYRTRVPSPPLGPAGPIGGAAHNPGMASAVHYHTHYEIKGLEDANLETKLRHAEFRNRHRHQRMHLTGDRYDI